MNQERLYRVHFVHKDGRHTVLTPHLMTHKEACTVLSKGMDRTRPQCMLVEGVPHPCVEHDPANARGRGPHRYCLECLEELAEEAAKTKTPERNRLTRAD